MFGKTIKAAFRATIPVLLGYMSIGIAFGVLINEIGYNFLWAGAMSITIYAGTMQFLLVNILKTGMGIGEAALLTLIVHLRHTVYGLSMLEKFKDMGKRKLYMIFSLTDETYALLCSAKAPEGVKNRDFYFAVALLDQLYWITGSMIGAFAGSVLRFDTKGIGFAMTALFLVICIEQWLTSKKHRPAIIGLVSSIVAIAFFGSQNMLIPSILCVIVFLLANKRSITESMQKEGEAHE